MSGAISRVFANCRAEGRAALVGYLTAFDPDRDRSRERFITACESGLDILELGLPFSDPAADGPAIQRAMTRGLSAGATVAGTLEMAAEIRRRVSTPIVLFSYANPLLQYGPSALARDAAAAGVNGLLVVDLPPEAADELREPARQRGLDWIPLLAPTTTPARRQQIVASASGFAYLVSLKGVTGAALRVDDPELVRIIEDHRSKCPVPVAVGFGVRTPEQAASLARRADGVVVGTALIEAAQHGLDALRDAVVGLRAAMRSSVRGE